MKLKDYIKKHKTTIKALSANKAFSGYSAAESLLSKASRGHRVGPAFALKVEQATSGAVTIEEMLYPQGELSRYRARRRRKDEAEVAMEEDDA